jgi:hypothetical protein
MSLIFLNVIKEEMRHFLWQLFFYFNDYIRMETYFWRVASTFIHIKLDRDPEIPYLLNFYITETTTRGTTTRLNVCMYLFDKILDMSVVSCWMAIAGCVSCRAS